MTKCQVKMHVGACIALRNSAGVQAEIKRKLNEIHGRVRATSISRSAVWKADVRTGRTRAQGRLKADNYAARLEEARHNTIAKAIQ